MFWQSSIAVHSVLLFWLSGCLRVFAWLHICDNNIIVLNLTLGIKTVWSGVLLRRLAILGWTFNLGDWLSYLLFLRIQILHLLLLLNWWNWNWGKGCLLLLYGLSLNNGLSLSNNLLLHSYWRLSEVLSSLLTSCRRRILGINWSIWNRAILNVSSFTLGTLILNLIRDVSWVHDGFCWNIATNFLHINIDTVHHNLVEFLSDHVLVWTHSKHLLYLSVARLNCSLHLAATVVQGAYQVIVELLTFDQVRESAFSNLFIEKFLFSFKMVWLVVFILIWEELLWSFEDFFQFAKTVAVMDAGQHPWLQVSHSATQIAKELLHEKCCPLSYQIWINAIDWINTVFIVLKSSVKLSS